jgi:hypothetical protein
LFQARLDQQLNLQHPLVQLAQQIEWEFFEREYGALYVSEVGRPGIPTRVLVGLHYLKHAYGESDESVVARWVENPLTQRHRTSDRPRKTGSRLRAKLLARRRRRPHQCAVGGVRLQSEKAPASLLCCPTELARRADFQGLYPQTVPELRLGDGLILSFFRDD